MIVCEEQAKSAYLHPCSIFSNGRQVFQQIKNSRHRFANNTLRTIHAKLQIIWLSSFRGEDFQRYNIKKAKKNTSRGVKLSSRLTDFHKIWERNRSDYAE